MPTFYEESFAQEPLQTIVPAYVYTQYNDDEYVTAFFTAFNEMAQGYLDWFNETPLPVWTSPNVSGSLLDYIGNNIYGISRPVISTSGKTTSGELGTNVLGTHPMGTLSIVESGTAKIANDDIYKRVLTWTLFKGDGIQMSVEWIRKRIARFLYGVDGTDINVGLITNVSLTFPSFPYDSVTGELGTNILGIHPMGVLYSKRLHDITITLPSGTVSTVFYDLFQSGDLPMPFQMNFTVQIA